MRSLIRFFGGLMALLSSLGLMAFGAALFVMHKRDVYDQVDQAWRDLIAQGPANLPYRQILGGALVVLGLIMFLSVFIRGPKNRRRRSISFAGMHGEVTIELEHVEGVVENVAKKLPEVRAISIRLEPTESRQRVLVQAEAVLMKDADAEARQVTDRVQDYIKQHTRKILGVQEVDVRLTVRKFLLNMRTVKPLPLLLEGPKETAVVPIQVPVSDAAAPQQS
jgi:hypothetical protein